MGVLLIRRAFCPVIFSSKTIEQSRIRDLPRLIRIRSGLRVSSQARIHFPGNFIATSILHAAMVGYGFPIRYESLMTDYRSGGASVSVWCYPRMGRWSVSLGLMPMDEFWSSRLSPKKRTMCFGKFSQANCSCRDDWVSPKAGIAGMWGNGRRRANVSITAFVRAALFLAGLPNRNRRKSSASGGFMRNRIFGGIGIK